MTDRITTTEDTRPTDCVLVSRFLSGDMLAFAQIADRYRSKVRRECYGILRSADKADDATQAVFARALEKLHSLRCAEKVESWLKAIALHHCLDLVSREPVCVDTAAVGDVLRSRDPNPEEHFFRFERWSAITQLIRSLPSNQRVVFQMKYMEGYTYREIESATGLSDKQVKSYLQNALRNVRQAVINQRPRRFRRPRRTMV